MAAVDDNLIKLRDRLDSLKAAGVDTIPGNINIDETIKAANLESHVVNTFAKTVLRAAEIERVGKGAENYIFAAKSDPSKVLRVNTREPFSDRARTDGTDTQGADLLSEMLFHKLMADMFPQNVPAVHKLYYAKVTCRYQDNGGDVDGTFFMWGVIMTRFYPYNPLLADKEQQQQQTIFNANKRSAIPGHANASMTPEIATQRVVYHVLDFMRNLCWLGVFHSDLHANNFIVAFKGVQLFDFGVGSCAFKTWRWRSFSAKRQATLCDADTTFIPDSFQTSPPELMETVIQKKLHGKLEEGDWRTYTRPSHTQRDGKIGGHKWDSLWRLHDIASMAYTVAMAVQTIEGMDSTITERLRLIEPNSVPLPVLGLQRMVNEKATRSLDEVISRARRAVLAVVHVYKTTLDKDKVPKDYKHRYIVYEYAAALVTSLMNSAQAIAVSRPLAQQVYPSSNRLLVNDMTAVGMLNNVSQYVSNKDLWKLLLQCLHPDPAVRPSENALKYALDSIKKVNRDLFGDLELSLGPTPTDVAEAIQQVRAATAQHADAGAAAGAKRPLQDVHRSVRSNVQSNVQSSVPPSVQSSVPTGKRNVEDAIQKAIQESEAIMALTDEQIKRSRTITPGSAAAAAAAAADVAGDMYTPLGSISWSITSSSASGGSSGGSGSSGSRSSRTGSSSRSNSKGGS